MPPSLREVPPAGGGGSVRRRRREVRATEAVAPTENAILIRLNSKLNEGVAVR
ncbi:MAG: hypothetical protein FWG90_12475 [Oscillospiraceae bacterium]|nr:hypothetical protein [Oscillospiraceae bacterium]